MLPEVLTLLATCALVTADDGYVTLPITRVPVPVDNAKLVTKNAKVDVIPEVLSNIVYQYLVSFSLGNNQQQEASIDTGSSDLWVYGPDSGADNTFDPSNSQYVNDGFSIKYLDRSYASGNYYKDNIEWGSTTINFQFAVTPTYSPPQQPGQGVFGIAQEGLEGSRYGTYPNFPVALKNAGKIQSAAYSLYLDNLSADNGLIVFGAVDTSRYTGTLKQIPITSNTRFSVDFEVLNHQLNGILDAGTSFTYLPDDIVAEIANSLGATYDSSKGAYRAPLVIPSQSLTYTFDGTPITVPASELWFQLVSRDNSYYLTVLPYSQSKNVILLGDSFLRSAYVVYDIDSHQIAIAQANWNPGPSNYEIITSSGIPGAQ